MSENKEHEHDDVYGKTFELYGKRELLEFIEPLQERFDRNGIDPRAAFENKFCLDAGCGNGRGAIFMKSNGASNLAAVDISPTNVESTQRNLELFGFDDFEVHQSSLESLPFDDESFDFVWCNGVLMHTANPDACLAEISRVLKVGGQAWIYVYGAGGIYWYAMRHFRDAVRHIDSERCIAALRLIGYSVRYVAEFIDDWKTPYLRMYTAQEFGDRLESLGYGSCSPLSRGVVYDTSERRHLYPDSAAWVGEGDLRYFLTKVQKPQDNSEPINGSEYGSDVAFHPSVVSRYGPLLASILGQHEDDDLAVIAKCANVHKGLRDLLSVEGDLDVAKIEKRMRDVESFAIAMGQDAPSSMADQGTTNLQVDAYSSERLLKHHETKMIRILSDGGQLSGDRCRLLDIGCADGVFLRVLRNEFPRAVLEGLEGNSTFVERGRELNTQHDVLVHDTLEKDFTPTEKYDVITASGILAMFDDPMPAIDRWLGWLKPGGELTVFSTFNQRDCDTRILFRNNIAGTGWERGLTGYSIASFSRALKDRDLNIEFVPFDLPMDIPFEPNGDPIRSYTETTEDGRRIVVAANILCNFHHMIIRVPHGTG